MRSICEEQLLQSGTEPGVNEHDVFAHLFAK
jgi:hypothetical protein